MDVSAISSVASAASGAGGGAPLSLRNAHTPAEQRKAAAGQFEAILLRQFLGESVSSMMGGEDTPAGSVYGYMLTDVMSNQLAQGGGMGLGKVIERQFTPRGETAAPASAPPAS